MAKVSILQLKNWFKKGLKPTESQFGDWLDSYFHKDEKVPIASVDGLQTELNTYRKKNIDIQIDEVAGLEDALANAGGGSSETPASIKAKLESITIETNKLSSSAIKDLDAKLIELKQLSEAGLR